MSVHKVNIIVQVAAFIIEVSKFNCMTDSRLYKKYYLPLYTIFFVLCFPWQYHAGRKEWGLDLVCIRRILVRNYRVYLLYHIKQLVKCNLYTNYSLCLSYD